MSADLRYSAIEWIRVDRQFYIRNNEHEGCSDKNIYQPKKIRNTREVVFVIAVFSHTRYTVKNVNEWSLSLAGNPGKSLNKLFMAGNTSSLVEFFPGSGA
jgi:hypothetical protein